MVSKAEINKGFKTVTVDVEDVYNAIKENGYEHIRDSWIQKNPDGSPRAACVLGQGALNLGVVHSHLYDVDDYEGFQPYIDASVDNSDPFFPSGTLETDRLISAIDDKTAKYSLEAQLDRFKVKKSSKWFHSQHGETLNAGGTIVYWNDALDGYEYALKTYQEVTDMAYDVLKPHFGKKVTLLTYEFSVEMSALGAVPA